MSIQTPSTAKFVIRQQIVTTQARPINMFTNKSIQSLENLSDDQVQIKDRYKDKDKCKGNDTVKEYMVVGDLEFKRRYCAQRNSNDSNNYNYNDINMNLTLDKLTNLQSTNLNTMYYSQKQKQKQKSKSKQRQQYITKQNQRQFMYAKQNAKLGRNINMNININMSKNINKRNKEKYMSDMQQELNYRIKAQGNSIDYVGDRQKRALVLYEWNRKRQQKLQNYLLKKRLSTTSNYNYNYNYTNNLNSSFLSVKPPSQTQTTNKKLNTTTISYNKQQVQIYPNPQLITLINDNIPEYWKNSLRDNQKRLKKHIKGNPFKKQIAQEMLQTVQGRKKLRESIPGIKRQYFSLSKNTGYKYSCNFGQGQSQIQDFVDQSLGEGQGNKRKKKNLLVNTFTILGRQHKQSCKSATSTENQQNHNITTNSLHNNIQNIPKIACEQVYKIQYSPAYKY